MRNSARSAPLRWSVLHMHEVRAHDLAVTRAHLLCLALLVAACKGELGDRCEDSADCRAGLDCLYSQVLGYENFLGAGGTRCGTECRTHEDCEAGSVCWGGGVCVPECRSSADCIEGTVCLEEACALTCDQDSDCRQGTCPTAGGLCEQ